MEEEKYVKIFSALKEIEPPAYLFQNIKSAVNKETARGSLLKARIFSAGAVAAVAAVIPAVKYAAENASRSGFYEYLRLIVSDGGVVISNWREFALSLAESMPVMETSVSLAVILLALILMKAAMKNMGIANLQSNAI